jgi:hypothetical protein
MQFGRGGYESTITSVVHGITAIGRLLGNFAVLVL